MNRSVMTVAAPKAAVTKPASLVRPDAPSITMGDTTITIMTLTNIRNTAASV